MFAFCSNNKKIEAVYGSYNFWSWLKYWHIDSADYINLMLLDKDYYDYDYESPDKEVLAYKNAAKNDNELAERLRSLGFKVKAKKPDDVAEHLQKEVMAEINNK